MPIEPEVLKELEHEWLENRARQLAEEHRRRFEAGEFTVELESAPDDPPPGDPVFQKELGSFTRSLRNTGLQYKQSHLVMDAVDAGSYALPHFTIAMQALKDLGPAIIGAVAGCTAAWVTARPGRKLRLRIADIEAEGRTMEEIEALLKKAANFQDERRAAAEKQDGPRIVDP
jgi:hypothetical protein